MALVQLNKYPGYRTFTAIGSGGEEFKAAMVKVGVAIWLGRMQGWTHRHPLLAFMLVSSCAVSSWAIEQGMWKRMSTHAGQHHVMHMPPPLTRSPCYQRCATSDHQTHAARQPFTNRWLPDIDIDLQAVESVVGTVHMECISQRPSSKGQYISVKIGPVPVQNPEQVCDSMCEGLGWGWGCKEVMVQRALAALRSTSEAPRP